MKTKTISIVVAPDVQLIDVSGPLDVFSEANRQFGQAVYRLEIIGTIPGPLRSSSGVRLLSDRVAERPCIQRPHTLLVAGTPAMADFRPTAGLIEWLRDEASRARRYGSICSGAFLLAATGMLNGRRVATHWAVADRLQSTFPAIVVEKDALYVCDGPVRTAAGVTAGMDLALALVEEDLGRALAMKVAGQLVMFFKRPGGQLQFSRDLNAAPIGRSILQELQRWVCAHPAKDHSVPNLAARAGLSTRHFARLFKSEMNVTPATWVEIARVGIARQRLEQEDSSPKQVATQCGFADVDVLRRAFYRHVGVTPAEYRKRFCK